MKNKKGLRLTDEQMAEYQKAVKEIKAAHAAEIIAKRDAYRCKYAKRKLDDQ